MKIILACWLYICDYVTVGSLYDITLLMLSVSETPGLNSIVGVLFTCVCRTLYGPLVLLPNLQGFSFFLEYPLLKDIVILTMLLIFLVRFSFVRFSCLCVIVCQSAIRGMLRNMSLLNARLPGLLPRVKCIAALMACIVMNMASYCLPTTYIRCAHSLSL